MIGLYCVTFAVLIGVLVAALLPLGYLGFAVGGLVISLLTLVVNAARCKSLPRLMQFGLAFLLGLSWAYLQSSSILNGTPSEKLFKKPVIVEGTVVGLPQVTANGVVFEAKIDKICSKQQYCETPHARFRFHWHQGHGLQAGQGFVARARLSSLQSLSNPGQRDQARQQFVKKIAAQGRISSLNLTGHDQHSFATYCQRLRQFVLARVEPQLADYAYGPMLLALAMGVKQGFTAEDWHVMKATGTSHLMAISGLHIGLIAGLFLWVGRHIAARGLQPHATIPSHYGGYALGCIAAAGYCLLAGGAMPTVRALIMILLVLGMRLLNFRLHHTQVLCFTLFIMIVWDVVALYSEGFWLSFVAVFFILLIVQQPTKRQAIKLQALLFMGMLPLTLGFFSGVSLIAPFTNLWAIPVIGMAVVPLTLIGVVLSLIFTPLASMCFFIADRIFALNWLLLEWISRGPVYWEQAITWPIFISLLLGGLILCLPKGIPGRWLGLTGLLPLCLLKNPTPAWGEAWYDVLDVGQGLAVLIRTHEHTLLFDTGPRYGPGGDIATQVLRPFLLAQQVKQLDRVIISHLDHDHQGGFAGLVRYLKPGSVWTNEIAPALAGPWSVSRCTRGQSWQWDGVQFDILHPYQAWHRGRNENSCVLQVTVGQQRLLLTGDIEQKAEAELLKYDRSKLQSDIIVVPHHGSLTSSTPAFIAAVAPQYALVSVGKDNRYHLPQPQVKARYQAVGSHWLQTDEQGAISGQLHPAQPLLPPVGWRTTTLKWIWHQSQHE